MWPNSLRLKWYETSLFTHTRTHARTCTVHHTVHYITTYCISCTAHHTLHTSTVHQHTMHKHTTHCILCTKHSSSCQIWSKHFVGVYTDCQKMQCGTCYDFDTAIKFYKVCLLRVCYAWCGDRRTLNIIGLLCMVR